MKNIRSGITFGIIGGLLTFLFGGWSVTVIGCLMGVGLGMGMAGRFERKDPLKIALAVLPSALTAAVLLVGLSSIKIISFRKPSGNVPPPKILFCMAT